MDRTFSLVAGAAVAAGILMLVFAYGPVVTAFFLAAGSFALMVALMAFTGVHAVEHWWRSHSWSLRRTKTP